MTYKCKSLASVLQSISEPQLDYKHKHAFTIALNYVHVCNYWVWIKANSSPGVHIQLAGSCKISPAPNGSMDPMGPLVPSNTTKRFTSAVFMAATTSGFNPQRWWKPQKFCCNWSWWNTPTYDLWWPMHNYVFHMILYGLDDKFWNFHRAAVGYLQKPTGPRDFQG